MINLCQILGRVGKIETKTVGAGLKVCNMSIVTSKKFTKNGEKHEKVTWHNVSCFSKLAEIGEKYVSVGDLLYIAGEMENQKYTSKEGVERSKTFVIANEIKLMPKAKEHKTEAKKDIHNGFAFDDDVVPF